MPYIKRDRRIKYGHLIEHILYDLRSDIGWCEGDLNYIISSVIWRLFDQNPCYGNGNNLMGLLECIKQEFYRRKLAPYEDMKIKENGDVG